MKSENSVIILSSTLSLNPYFQEWWEDDEMIVFDLFFKHNPFLFVDNFKNYIYRFCLVWTINLYGFLTCRKLAKSTVVILFIITVKFYSKSIDLEQR